MRSCRRRPDPQACRQPLRAKAPSFLRLSFHTSTGYGDPTTTLGQAISEPEFSCTEIEPVPLGPDSGHTGYLRQDSGEPSRALSSSVTVVTEPCSTTVNPIVRAIETNAS